MVGLLCLGFYGCAFMVGLFISGLLCLGFYGCGFMVGLLLVGFYGWTFMAFMTGLL